MSMLCCSIKYQLLALVPWLIKLIKDPVLTKICGLTRGEGSTGTYALISEVKSNVLEF